MPSLSIKNVPEDLLAKLRRRAERHHRSLQGELMSILEEATAPRDELTVDELHAYVRSLDLHTPDESTEIVRRDRDSR